MARQVAQRSVDRYVVITVFEEGIKQKQVEREIEESFHMSTLHPCKSGYEWANETQKYIPKRSKRK